jgi:hypothetical protein
MKYSIKNNSILKQILWADTTLGATTAIIGLIFTTILSDLLGLSTSLIKTVCIITFIYAVVAFMLANQKIISIPLLRLLVYANWGWTIISTMLLVFHIAHATIFGIVFLILQIIVVGILAYLEGKQIVKNNFI